MFKKILNRLKLFFAMCYAVALDSDIVKNTKGALTGKIVGIVVALYVAGAMLPSAIVLVSNSTNYSGADTTVITICTVLLPMLGVVGIALALLYARKRG